ncbi:hypothetical protein OOK31_29430 [Streptomyces sp. NBC_00249]|uniref:hypothetical protein n=1 Tax=Streptomyces sp. NBC_00249 TaxID=2975690 RepID=UPI00225A4DC0|nr:hypothetical protein [Streptomyces sp. NBC_00249]MCX5197966.1 hypothetical protein [Streptomyces sp. NBC_00249]
MLLGPRERLRAWRRTRPFWGGLLLVLLAGGAPRKVLVLKMAAASLRGYRLRGRDGGREYGLAADSLQQG